MMTVMIGNYRVRQAIAAIRIAGRNPETRAELFDALNARAKRRNQHLTTAELHALEVRYLAEHAPDLLRRR